VVAAQRPIPVLGDRDRLQQVVWNLLTNAIKFSDEGGRVDVLVRASDSMASVSVHDWGRGIEPSFLPHVFDHFRQQDSSTTRAHGGLGLGLALVQSIVRAHGGLVHASSAGPGKGSRFRFEIPVDRNADGTLPMVRRDETQADLRGVQIVVVDDRPDERDLFAEVLSRAGAVVDTADSAANALRTIEQLRPDIVVSDLAMPEEDGYLLVAKLRRHSDPSIAATPAIALTAHARAEDRQNALRAGFQSYVSKPVEPKDLVHSITALLSAGPAR
jgi:CheY-like chemotaxis protein